MNYNVNNILQNGYSKMGWGDLRYQNGYIQGPVYRRNAWSKKDYRIRSYDVNIIFSI